MSGTLNSQGKNIDVNKSQINRLPCRGCTKNCTNYQYCNGKLWRMNINNNNATNTNNKISCD